METPDMIIVYVAGPFRGPTPWDVAQNVMRAKALGLEVARAGFMPLIPHANTDLFDGQLTDQFWIDGTLALMRRCDAVVLVEGWERSNGTLGEIAEAKRLGIPVCHSVDELLDWARNAP